jgi:hypothetical protein
MERQRRAPSAARARAALAAGILAVVSASALAGPSFGAIEAQEAASVQPRKGTYKGKTSQASVEAPFRQIALRVKGKRITLITEPVVRHGFCLSPPVFVEEGAPAVTKRISGNGTFAFERTFEGSRMNLIRGTFVDEKTIEGRIRYFFPDSASGQCVAGKETPRFTATR